jgi:hypothetical protein
MKEIGLSKKSSDTGLWYHSNSLFSNETDGNLNFYENKNISTLIEQRTIEVWYQTLYVSQ